MNIVPTNLSECFDRLDEIFQEAPLEYKNFKSSSEEEAVITLHYGLGKWIRNNWGLWEGNSPISKTLYSMHLWHAEDMSTLILTSYHRHINNKPLELKQQVDHFIGYWKDYEKTTGPVKKQKIK